jgi:hypothetical protein
MKRLGSVLGAVACILVSVVALLGDAEALGHLDVSYLARQDRLDRSPGRIVAVDDDGTDEQRVTVRYGPDSDHLRTAEIGSVEGDWSEGQRVVVLVDPGDPDSITLPGENYLPWWFNLLFITLLLPLGGVGVGIASLWRLRKAASR